MADNRYKICILGFGKLSEMAREVVAQQGYEDLEIKVEDVLPDALAQTVASAQAEGFEVFIAGSSNAAEFQRNAYGHLAVISVGIADYLEAIRKAVSIGGTQPLIIAYRDGAPVDIALLRELSGVPVSLARYEDTSDLREILRTTRCDVVIGASFVNSVAEAMSFRHILVYAGEYTIRRTIFHARNMAIELREERRNSEITRSIIDHTPVGIIVTDEHGVIQIFNSTAREATNLRDAKVKGRQLEEVLPILSPRKFMLSSAHQAEKNHLLGGTLVKCTQTKIRDANAFYGVLTTLFPGNFNKKAPVNAAESRFRAHGRWQDIIGSSPAIQQAKSQIKLLASSKFPLAICGEPGTSRDFFAQCIHNASPWAGEPFIVLDASFLAPQDTARVLFGVEGSDSPGLFEQAGSGTIVIQDLSRATQVFSSCLHSVLSNKYFIRVGGTSPIPFQARVITVADGEEEAAINPKLWQQLTTYIFRTPPLRQRVEDIPQLFYFFFRQESMAAYHYRTMEELVPVLTFYSWPGNLIELNNVAQRYAVFYQERSIRSTGYARQKLLIKAIGEDKLLRDILEKYPSLRDISNSPPEDVVQGLALIKRLLRWNEATIAQRLNTSRTTLWRLRKNGEASLELEEEPDLEDPDR